MELITSQYYEQNAEQYVTETVHLDVRHLYAQFLEHVPSYGHILDAGCGSGRDTLYFLKNGYEVTAFDRSSALVEKAQLHTGIDVKVLSFEDMDYEDAFDGIWACASLLHMSYEALSAVCKKLRRALKPNGVLYCSFKEGLEDWTDAKGRFFVGMTVEKLRILLKECGFICLQVNLVRSPKEETWISAIAH